MRCGPPPPSGWPMSWRSKTAIDPGSLNARQPRLARMLASFRPTGPTWSLLPSLPGQKRGLSGGPRGRSPNGFRPTNGRAKRRPEPHPRNRWGTMPISRNDRFKEETLTDQDKLRRAIKALEALSDCDSIRPSSRAAIQTCARLVTTLLYEQGGELHRPDRLSGRGPAHQDAPHLSVVK